MKKIFVINGGHQFAHSGGKLNDSITGWDSNFFTPGNGYELKVTNVSEGGYDPEAEVAKFLWADLIIYHFPVWWFHMPYSMKHYLDQVLTAGHRKGMYHSDGRKAENPAINYGKGGQLHGRKYMVTTTWNAPETAFTLPGEFFDEKSVDEGILFPFHRMNAFLALEPLSGMHFHDVEKNASPERLEGFEKDYLQHLKAVLAA